MNLRNGIVPLIVSCLSFIPIIYLAWNAPNAACLLLLVCISALPTYILYTSWTGIIGPPSSDLPLEFTDHPNQPEGFLICRFWGGFWGNQEAEIMIDPTHSELLFVRCLVPFRLLATPLPSIRVNENDLLFFREYFYKQCRSLIITTKHGRAIIPMSASNFLTLRVIMKSRFRNEGMTSELGPAFLVVFAGLMGVGLGVLATPSNDNGFWLILNLILGCAFCIALASCITTAFSWPTIASTSESKDYADRGHLQ